jgi:hypothetical protein
LPTLYKKKNTTLDKTELNFVTPIFGKTIAQNIREIKKMFSMLQ